MAKKLTVAQMETLNQHGIEDAHNYLYLKTTATTLDGKHNPSKNKDKTITMHVVHKSTGEVVSVEL